MIQWVYEAARRARGLDDVIVATDDERIEKAVRSFGGKAMLTDPAIPSGTDRVAAVADRERADIYINVQGDEPMMRPEGIERALELVASGRFPMGTIMSPLTDPADLANPAVVKVIADRHGRAMFFSRHPIPYSRGAPPPRGEPHVCRRHLGLYVYTRETLQRIRSLPPCALEKAELLEQLRAMEDGIPIGIAEVGFTSFGVDTPEELEKARTALTGSVRGNG